jgi:predicted RNase H-like nuclease (RuvC/YqgF family)
MADYNSDHNNNNSNNSRSDMTASQRDLDDLHRKFDEHYAERMDRIEKKLNQLTDAVVSIARAEEKITVLIEDTREIKEALSNNIQRIHQLEIDNEKTKSSLKNLGMIFWTAVSAVTTVVVAIVISNYGI